MTLPSELVIRPQWVMWRWEKDDQPADATTPKATKVPYNARTGNKASSTNAKTWASYESALAAVTPHKCSGVGFVFTEKDPYTGIDLDDCIDEHGVIADWAQAIVDTMQTYTEISPSGHGLKLWVVGQIPDSVKTEQIEMYSSGRYFTVTGAQLAGSPSTIRDVGDALMALYTKVKKPTAKLAPRATTVLDDTYLRVWADRVIETAIEKMRFASDGTQHNMRYDMGRLLGGLISHGVMNEDRAFRLIYDCNIPAANDEAERKAIIDGIYDGKDHALLPPDPPAPPLFESGWAVCPKHLIRLPAAKNGNGYKCHQPDPTTASGWCDFWWKGDGYVMPRADVDVTTGEVKARKPATEYVTQPEGLESADLIQRLETLGFTFRLNLCTDSIEVNGVKISDVMAAEIRTALRDASLTKKIPAAEDAYVSYAKKRAYHPIHDYLNGLKWDGNDHISQFVSCMESSDPPIIYSDGTAVAQHAVYWYRWLIGACAKALDAHQLMMLVLDGPTNLGKSTLCAWLCHRMPDYFIESSINPNDKDTDIRLIDRWIWEVAELDATTRKADQSALKSFITKRHVTVRKAYGRYDITKPALAFLIGTVNNSTGFLTDDTGNRRFMITRLEKLDFAYEMIDVDQLWAQAVHLYRAGEPWKLVGEEKQAQDITNLRYERETTLTDWVDYYFTFDPEVNDPEWSLAEILIVMSEKFKPSGTGASQTEELSRVLKSKGARKKHTRNGNRWVGLYTRAM